jgi:hypothetical protein
MELISEYLFFFLFCFWGWVGGEDRSWFADPFFLRSPEWNRTDAQIIGPGQPYSWESSWTFGLL